MRITKFYRVQKDGSVACIGVRTYNGPLGAITPTTVTLARAEHVMGQLGWARKNRLPKALRDKLPKGGGLHAARKVSIKKVADKNQS
jgi:hypothetical protein